MDINTSTINTVEIDTSAGEVDMQDTKRTAGEVDMQDTKRKQRFSEDQVRTLELIFGEFPCPNELQKQDMSKTLGLKPCQVQYWFQNKRAQMKKRAVQDDNLAQRIQKKKLLDENKFYKRALKMPFCIYCGETIVGGKHTLAELKLREENSKLMQQIQYLRSLVRSYGAGSYYPHMSHSTFDQEASSSQYPSMNH